MLIFTLLILSSLKANALAINEDNFTRPLAIAFNQSDVTSPDKNVFLFQRAQGNSPKIIIEVMGSGTLMYYFNSVGDFIFSEATQDPSMKRIMRRALLDKNCPVTFTVEPEAERFESIDLGCDSYASLEQENAFI